MRQKLPIVLSVTALLVAVLGFTSVGEAAKQALLPKNSVTSREIKNKSIRGIDIRPSQIGSGKIKNNTIRSADLRDGEVGEADLGDGAVTGSKVGDGAVTSSKLGDKSVTTSKWAGGPSARVYNSGNVSIATAPAVGVIPLNSERFDGSGMHDPAANSTRITIATPGIYLIGANVTWEPNSTGARELNLRVNGSDLVARVVQDAATAPNTTDQHVSSLVSLAAGDYVEIAVRHNAGAPVNVLASSQFSPELWATWIGPAS